MLYTDNDKKLIKGDGACQKIILQTKIFPKKC